MTDSGTITLVDGVLLCRCPDCGAPMAMRLWLMTADCWQCHTSIQLSIEDVRTARGLLAAAAADRPTPHQRASVPAAPLSAVGVGTRAVSSTHSEPGAAAPAPRRTDAKTAAAPLAAAQRLAVLRRKERLLDLAACLISLVFHLVLMLLLGLWTLDPERVAPGITLSASISTLDRLGAVEHDDRSVLQADFESEEPDRSADDPTREALALARRDAAQLRFGPGDANGNLPRIAVVKADLASADPDRRMHAARDPRVRTAIVRQEGGTTLTEAAVARALRWIARHQDDDGSWSLRHFHRAGDCRRRCQGIGRVRSRAGGTALALMAMLGAGQTHQFGIYRRHVQRGLDWLLENQRLDGDLRADSDHQAGMYVHGQAAIVLCDALRLSRDGRLQLPAQQAIDFLGYAQHAAGGWRYVPGQPGDTSVLGWQLMAIYSAKAAAIDVSEETLRGAAAYLDRAQTDRAGAHYAYLPGGPATAAMTAEGLLSRMYLGWNRRTRGLHQGVLDLLSSYPPDADRPNIYYWYYATQVMHHWGGEPWETWNFDMREVLVSTQERSGHAAGSWRPRGPHAPIGGRLYMTALAACTLEVYYRHAPLYRKIDLR